MSSSLCAGEMHAHDRLGVSGPAATVLAPILLVFALRRVCEAATFEVVRATQRLRAARAVIAVLVVQSRTRGLRQVRQTLVESVSDLHVAPVVPGDLPLRLLVACDGCLGHLRVVLVHLRLDRTSVV